MDKKNTILLTVIAVATLLVAVVGATFAYFTAQMGEGANTNIVVTTSTQDTLSYGAFNALTIIADQENFAKNKGTQMATAKGTISLQSNSNTQDGEDYPKVDYCYTATINIKTNQFEYAPAGTKDDSNGEVTGSENPELVLALKKDGTLYGSGEISGLETFKEFTGKTVCDQSDGKYTFTDDDASCQSNKSFSGYDVTELGKNEQYDIKIPNKDAEDDKEYVFHISATQGNQLVVHNWEASLYFVNYDWDQQYNTHKMFVATWTFETVNCDTGAKE